MADIPKFEWSIAVRETRRYNVVFTNPVTAEEALRLYEADEYEFEIPGKVMDFEVLDDAE